LVSIEDSLYLLEKSIYDPVVLPPLPVEVSNDSLKIIEVANAQDSLINIENLKYHKVQSGENLKNISLKYNVTIEQLMEWNALRTTNIYIGQKLKLYSIEKPVIETVVPKPVKKYYNVKSGDSFSRVAQKHNLTQGQLQNLNPGININRITVGQRLRIK
jgi:LysM repeat protein